MLTPLRDDEYVGLTSETLDLLVEKRSEYSAPRPGESERLLAFAFGIEQFCKEAKFDEADTKTMFRYADHLLKTSFDHYDDDNDNSMEAMLTRIRAGQNSHRLNAGQYGSSQVDSSGTVSYDPTFGGSKDSKDVLNQMNAANNGRGPNQDPNYEQGSWADIGNFVGGYGGSGSNAVNKRFERLRDQDLAKSKPSGDWGYIENLDHGLSDISGGAPNSRKADQITAQNRLDGVAANSNKKDFSKMTDAERSAQGNETKEKMRQMIQNMTLSKGETFSTALGSAEAQFGAPEFANQLRAEYLAKNPNALGGNGGMMPSKPDSGPVTMKPPTSTGSASPLASPPPSRPSSQGPPSSVPGGSTGVGGSIPPPRASTNSSTGSSDFSLGAQQKWMASKNQQAKDHPNGMPSTLGKSSKPSVPGGI